MEKNWTKVFVSTDPNLVDLLVTLLKEKEITAVSINKKDSSYTVFGNIELYVKATDVEESEKIINLYNERNS
ncbi:DUF2007 domain-containing protein [Flavobacteriales bacterium]|jgi:hypothetical protein|nr:DUF2007 domain-containing protein [Flavobacteriales bacterium]